MIILLDTDILLDVALGRAPHSAAAGTLLDLLESRPRTAFVAWHTLSNVHYLVASRQGRDAAGEFLAELVVFVDVAPTTRESFRLATRLPMRDFEDAMQVAAAVACGADVIATRNLRDYARAPVRAATPLTILHELS